MAFSAAYVAPKVPLDVKADCSGASRVPFNGQAETTSAGSCAPDATDSDCMACLRTPCCAVVDVSCAGTSAAACATMAAVESCFVGALANLCAEQCPEAP
ncbi:MAG TPA: hypothetical protein VK762_07135 [Polyangiaceae bacterium]|nr:hypothetical protein [Polyangiaceae bacterium]